MQDNDKVVITYKQDGVTHHYWYNKKEMELLQDWMETRQQEALERFWNHYTKDICLCLECDGTCKIESNMQ